MKLVPIDGLGAGVVKGQHGYAKTGGDTALNTREHFLIPAVRQDLEDFSTVRIVIINGAKHQFLSNFYIVELSHQHERAAKDIGQRA